MPLPHGHGSFGYTLAAARRFGAFCADSSLFVPEIFATCSRSTFCSPRFFCGFVKLRGKSRFQLFFQICQTLQFVNEEEIDAGNLMDSLRGDAVFQRFKYREKPTVVPIGKTILHIPSVHGGGVQRIQRDFRSAHRFHQRRFKTCADCHDLAGGFHLSAELPADSRKLVKRPFRKFDHHIVQRRLKAGAGFARDVVPDFVQRVAERDLCGDLGNRISGCLACKRRGARNARVDLDDCVFEGIRVQSKLAVAPAYDSERRDDFKRGAAQYLEFSVRKGQIGRASCRERV